MILLQSFGHDSIIIILLLLVFIIILIAAKPLNRLDQVLCHCDNKQPGNHDDGRMKRHEP